MVGSYPDPTWDYLGCDANYHYAYCPPATVLRLKKRLAPPDALSKTLEQREQWCHDLNASGRLTPQIQAPSGPFHRWLEQAHLDKSLLDQAEKACQLRPPRAPPIHVSPRHRLEPGDILYIEVLGIEKGRNATKSKISGISGQCPVYSSPVFPNGVVGLHDYGWVDVGGKTVREAKSAIEEHMTKYLEPIKLSVVHIIAVQADSDRNSGKMRFGPPPSSSAPPSTTPPKGVPGKTPMPY